MDGNTSQYSDPCNLGPVDSTCEEGVSDAILKVGHGSTIPPAPSGGDFNRGKRGVRLFRTRYISDHGTELNFFHGWVSPFLLCPAPPDKGFACKAASLECTGT